MRCGLRPGGGRGDASARRPLGFRAYVLLDLVRVNKRKPRLVLILCLVSAILCVFYARARLVLETSQTNLMGSTSPAQRNYLSYKLEFPERQSLVVVIDRHDRARAEQFADDLAANL